MPESLVARAVFLMSLIGTTGRASAVEAGRAVVPNDCARGEVRYANCPAKCLLRQVARDARAPGGRERRRQPTPNPRPPREGLCFR